MRVIITLGGDITQCSELCNLLSTALNICQYRNMCAHNMCAMYCHLKGVILRNAEYSSNLQWECICWSSPCDLGLALMTLQKDGKDPG